MTLFVNINIVKKLYVQNVFELSRETSTRKLYTDELQ